MPHLQPTRCVRATSTASGPPQSRYNSMRTCRRCKRSFNPEQNTDVACQYHSSIWTGGEVRLATISKQTGDATKECIEFTFIIRSLSFITSIREVFQFPPFSLFLCCVQVSKVSHHGHIKGTGVTRRISLKAIAFQENNINK